MAEAKPACVCPQAVGGHPSSFLSASLLGALMLGCLLLLWLLARCLQILSRLLAAVEKLETSTRIDSDRERGRLRRRCSPAATCAGAGSRQQKDAAALDTWLTQSPPSPAEIPDPMPVRRSSSPSNSAHAISLPDSRRASLLPSAPLTATESASMSPQVQPRSPTTRMRRSSSASAFTEIPDPMPVRRKPSTSNGFLDLPRRRQRSSSASVLTEIPDSALMEIPDPMPVRRTPPTSNGAHNNSLPNVQSLRKAPPTSNSDHNSSLAQGARELLSPLRKAIKSESTASQVQPTSLAPSMRRSTSALALTEIPDPMPVRHIPPSSNMRHSLSASALMEIPDPMPARVSSAAWRKSCNFKFAISNLSRLETERIL